MAEKKEQVIEELSVNNVKEMESKIVDAIKKNPDNKPTEEEIKEAEETFNSVANGFQLKSWDIGELEDAQEHIDYLNHFLENRAFWTKNVWMGMLRFKEELDDAEKFVKTNKGKSPLKLGYQALEFLYFILQSPGGLGIETAKSFEAENDKYVKIFDSVANILQGVRDELKEIQFLQDQVTALNQGFYLEREDGTIEAKEAREKKEAEEAEISIKEQDENKPVLEPEVVIGKVK